jgi:hypothetical protein
VKAVWDAGTAFREATATRERVCLNGLWRWQPAEVTAREVPAGNWGHFKVPGSWPGITDYMQKDSQTVFAHPTWQGVRHGTVAAAWYEREVSVPADWSGRRITLALEYLNSYAAIYLDGIQAGELRFPAGEADLSAHCRPGRTHRLSLLVVALPLKGVLQSYTDSASAREIKGSVARRGLCGDVFLVSDPVGPRINGVLLQPSVRERKLRLEAAVTNLAPDVAYSLRARLTSREPEPAQTPHEFTSPAFTVRDLDARGRMVFTQPWMPARLWDLHTPTNTCELELSLLEDGRIVRDAYWRERFGFREFWIEGRDFYLNGTRLFVSTLPLDNAQVGAAAANYEAARESLERLKDFGINFVYTHNYDCEPGSHLGFAEILQAADDTGMLVGLSQPHFSHYAWPNPEADRTNSYARHAEFFVQAAGNHPSVVMYAMSHNATGYNEDMNPDLIDGIQDVRDAWASRNVKLAQRAEAIVRQLDSGRIVYHHASGNLGPMHLSNFYPNWVPIQELSDWFEHWSTRGVKPVFLCEYGAPFTWDWTMYRGWYQGKREFGSARVPWEFCLAEWNAQFLGDRAFPASAAEQANLRWEARQFHAGNLWHRWDYPHQVGSTRFDERYPVFAAYLTDNWRAFRTWGVSAISPWEHGHFWQLREGVQRGRQALPVDWDHLQRPGFSPDYVDQRYERVDLAFARSDWIATPAAQALYRNNRPLLAYLAGKPARFTSKDHNFLAGETLEKQIVVINNSRATVGADVEWSLALPQPISGRERFRLPTGEQRRIPLPFRLPDLLPRGQYALRAEVVFETGARQEDVFQVDVMAPPPPNLPSARIALFDPPGETSAWLKELGVRGKTVTAQTDLSGFDLLVVGKGALTVSDPAPNIRRVRAGLKVVIFEQTSEALEQRFGFRVTEYGLRQVFPRVPDHPLLAGVAAEHLRDWRGAATILPPRLKYQLDPKFNGAPTVRWCDLPVTRAWRCGNQGNVASVLIEKPARGDFLPIVDGGYALQYSPLLVFREGRGLVLFCQMDVTGRTESDPAAARLAQNVLRFAIDWRPQPRRSAVYLGEDSGRLHLERIGVYLGTLYEGGLADDQVLILGPGCGEELASVEAIVEDHRRRGGHLLALGLDQRDLSTLPNNRVSVQRREHISASFPPPGNASLLSGISPADVHLRDPREVPLIRAEAQVSRNGVLGEEPRTAYCQIAPWHFATTNQMNLKRTHRRLSVALARLLGNFNVASSTPLLERFRRPVDADRPEHRWLEGFYLDQPEPGDDPYRFFRW